MRQEIQAESLQAVRIASR